jgi:hypothetical protein
MATLKQFADLMRLRLNVNSQDFPVDVDERVIIGMADKALGGLLPKYIQTYGIDAIGTLAVRQYFDVKYDENADLKYSDTEGKINAIAGNMGLLSVGLTQDDECAFIITKPAQQSIYSSLEAGQIKKIQVWQEGGRLYYKNLPFKVKQVVVRAIPNLLSMDMDDTIPIPVDLQDMIMDKISAIVFQNKAEDKPNDGIDNKQTISA